MKKSTIFLIILLAMFFTSTLVLLYLNSIKTAPVTLTETTDINPKPTLISTISPTTDWKTYTDTKNSFSFKYPSTWTNKTDSSTFQGKEFRIETDKGEFVNGFIFDRPANNSNTYAWSKEINLKNNKSILITYTDNLGPSSKGGVVDINIFNQIISTFKFTDNKTINPSPTTSSIKTIKYNLYQNWISVRDYSQLFEIAYNPSTQNIKMSSIGIDISEKTVQYITSNASYGIYDYDGASRHTFLYSFFGGKLTNQDKFSDFQETEYLIDGKNCLFLNGVSYSQSPVVWGMCPLSNSKALLITTWDRDNYVKALSTLKLKI